jgi:hypothetical protein
LAQFGPGQGVQDFFLGGLTTLRAASSSACGVPDTRGGFREIFRTELLRIPAHDVSKRFRHGARSHASQLGQRLVAVAPDARQWNLELTQARECLARHRPRQHVAPDHDLVDVRVTNTLEYRLERREVAVNVIHGRNPHDILLSR